MEITRVDTHTLALPEVERKAASTQDAVIVEVHTDEGITGIGQAASAPPVVIKACIEAPVSTSNAMGLREVVEGRDPFDVGVLWDEMYRRTYGYGRKGAAIAAISAVDMALWDVIGKATGRPVHDLLGGSHRESVRAYASTLFPADPTDTDHMVAECERALDDGFTAIKFGWGCFGDDVDDDRRLVSVARETLGEDVDLMLDAGMAFEDDAARAIRETNALDDAFDVFWMEEPVLADNVDGYARIAEATDTRVVGGEREYTVYGFRDFIDRGRVDGVQPDVGIAGGITQLVRIAALADDAGIPILPHGYSSDIVIAAGLHVIAASRNAPLLEYTVESSPIRWEVVNETFDVEDGRVAIPDAPGLGVSLNRDALDAYRVEPWHEW